MDCTYWNFGNEISSPKQNISQCLGYEISSPNCLVRNSDRRHINTYIDITIHNQSYHLPPSEMLTNNAYICTYADTMIISTLFK